MSLKRGEGRSVSLTLRRSSALSASTSGFSRHQKKFPNGDTYTGGWRNGLPEGEGRYCWADGSTYEGGWKVIQSADCTSESVGVNDKSTVMYSINA